MSPRQRQADLIERYAVIPDLQERLAAIVSRRSALPSIPPEERIEALLVRGCQSRVWIDGAVDPASGRCRFRVEAESAMVRGLVTILCEIYDDATPEEIAAVEPELFEKLGIAANLSPTRLNGIAAVRGHLAAFAGRRKGGCR